MTWQETLNRYFAQLYPKDALEFYPPVSDQTMELAEKELGVSFPLELGGLLKETNGVGLTLHLDQPSDEVFIGYLIWPIERIITDNTSFRTNSQITRAYLPFDRLLLFSDAGNGDLFGYAITSDGNCLNQILRWDHEDDRRICIAHSLNEFAQYMSH